MDSTDWIRRGRLALIGGLAVACLATVASAAGPKRYVPDRACKPLPGHKGVCVEDREWYVRRADGQGVVRMGFTRETIGLSGHRKARRKLGGSSRGDIPDNLMRLYKEHDARGLILAGADSPLEPAVYNAVYPISDTHALVEIYKDLAVDESPYFVVPLDGKLSALGPVVARYSHFVYMTGGYQASSPVTAFIVQGYDEATGRALIDQLGPDGKVAHRYDNILSSDDVLTFHEEAESGIVFAKAIDPASGAPASLRIGPDGEPMGYFPAIEFNSTIISYSKNSARSELLEEVGMLPSLADLEDTRLFHPLDAHGNKVQAPGNFIGMTPLHHPRQDFLGGTKTLDWVLVYRLAGGGFGFKVAGLGDDPWPVSHSARSVLAAEAKYPMFAGFDYRRDSSEGATGKTVDNLYAGYVVQLFTEYEADGLTPTPTSHAGPWRMIRKSPKEPMAPYDVRSTSQFPAGSWATREEALAASLQDHLQYLQTMKDYRARIARLEREAQQRAAAAYEQRMAEARRQYEQRQAFLAKQPAAKPNFFQALADGMKAYAEEMQRQSSMNRGTYSTNCYNNYNGTETCYTSFNRKL